MNLFNNLFEIIRNLYKPGVELNLFQIIKNLNNETFSNLFYFVVMPMKIYLEWTNAIIRIGTYNIHLMAKLNSSILDA